MPIYAYRCAACGHSRDVLQKMSDAPADGVPRMLAPRQFQKQLTARRLPAQGLGLVRHRFPQRQRGSGCRSGRAMAAPQVRQGNAATPAAPSIADGSAGGVVDRPICGGSGVTVH